MTNQQCKVRGQRHRHVTIFKNYGAQSYLWNGKFGLQVVTDEY